MGEDVEVRFSELVRRQLSAEGQDSALELWHPISQAFDREGPDSAIEYIRAEQQLQTNLLDSRLKQLEEE